MSEEVRHERRELGKTGLSVSRLGFGAMELAGMGSSAQSRDVETLLGTVLDSGINFIDTSPDYGASEELVGQHLSHRREEFFLASKCGCVVGRPPEFRGGQLEHEFTRANVRAGVEQSLRRLKTDRLDLVQVHMSPSRALLEETGVVDEMQVLKEEGKLRFLGMSGVLPDLEDHLEMGVFDVFQIPYSALQSEHEAVISRAANAGAGTIIRGGVARGAPAPDKAPDQMAGEGGGQVQDYWRPFIAEKRDAWDRAGLDELLDGMSRMEFMLRFVLGHPDLHTTIVGTSKPAHLVSNVAVAEKGPLSDALLQEAKRRISALSSAHSSAH